MKIEWEDWKEYDECEAHSILMRTFIQNKDACRVCIGVVDNIETTVILESFGDDIYRVYADAKGGGFAYGEINSISIEEARQASLLQSQEFVLKDRDRNKKIKDQVGRILERGRIPISSYDHDREDDVLEIFPAQDGSQELICIKMDSKEYARLEKSIATNNFFEIEDQKYELIDIDEV